MAFEREIRICGKMADFLIGEKLIIECDGDAHFGYSNLEPLYTAIIRNLTFILSGYKVIIIDIQELNELRKKEIELEELLMKKINLVNKPGIALVS